MRYIWDRAVKEWVPAHEYRPEAFKRSDGLQVISDTIDPLYHHATKQYYDSKAAFRGATKDAGCIEVGTEKQVDRRQPFVETHQLKGDVYEAIRKVNQGYRPIVPRESDDL